MTKCITVIPLYTPGTNWSYDIKWQMAELAVISLSYTVNSITSDYLKQNIILGC